MRRICLDPAKRRCGVAIFDDGGTLIEARTIAASYAALPYQVARLGSNRDAWIVESPQRYDRDREKHRDLDSLESLILAVEQLASVTMTRLRPMAWKGGAPKAVIERRVRGVLRATELRAVRDHLDDTYDAIGLGLVYLGRAKRGVV